MPVPLTVQKTQVERLCIKLISDKISQWFEFSFWLPLIWRSCCVRIVSCHFSTASRGGHHGLQLSCRTEQNRLGFSKLLLTA